VPVSRKTLSKQPIPRSRFQWSPLYDTREWKDAIKELKKGLKPQEYIEVELKPETIAQVPLKDPIGAMVVALRRHIRTAKLQVDVTTRAVTDGAHPVIYLVGRADRVA
jgi:hypothetical protein